jgi:hypothetical protein
MLKKTILLSAASIGTLTVASIASQPAQAQKYVSGSATVTNFTGSSSSVGAEIGGVTTNAVVVQPNYNTGIIFGFNSFVNNLNLSFTPNTNAAPLTITQVVAQNLSAIAGTNAANILGANNGINLAAYVSIVRAAGGNDGLE